MIRTYQGQITRLWIINLEIGDYGKTFTDLAIGTLPEFTSVRRIPDRIEESDVLTRM
jgi:hypothetical protein